MKKAFFIFGLLSIGAAASAQLKVSNNGNVGIHTNATPLSRLSINSFGDSLCSIYCLSLVNKGIDCQVYGNDPSMRYGGNFSTTAVNTTYRVFGVRAKAGSGFYTSTSSPHGYGIYGVAKGVNQGIGAMGQIQYCNKGAAVYGTVYNDFGTSIPDSLYAGFFNGNVSITGNLSVNGTLRGLVLGESSTNQESYEVMASKGAETLTSKIRGLSALQFQYKDEVRTSPKAEIELEEGEDSIELREPTIIDKQFYGKHHYALSADMIEEVFPDLVYEQENGKKAINYMEMIPLLVQCINELSSEVEALKKGCEMPMSRSTTSVSSKFQDNSVLYQNTPNPFTERTEIRFSVPDDARSAYIYIFDMAGKMLRQIPVNSSMQSVTINGYELSAGIYLYSLVINGLEIDTKRMILSK